MENLFPKPWHWNPVINLTKPKMKASELLEKSLRISDLIDYAHKKEQNIVNSPYYELFAKPGERTSELVKIRKVIHRLQCYFYKTIELAHESQI